MRIVTKVISLIGGPCAGKTSALQAISQLLAEAVGVVEEQATALFNAGWPAPDPWTPQWQQAFQAAIISAQYRAEAKARAEAETNGQKLIVCDRGLLDSAAYLPGGIQELWESFQVDEREALDRYDMVIHLESLATLDPAKYLELVSTNPHRFETLEQAQERELALRNAWKNHPHRIHLAGPLEESIARVLKILTRYI